MPECLKSQIRGLYRGPFFYDEPVRVTKRFLEEHPEEAEPFYSQKKIVSMDTISAFLNWPKSRVQFSLERLKMIDDDKAPPIEGAAPIP